MLLPDLALRVAPASLPITTAEAKLHCRVDHSAEDTYIDGLVAAATAYIESMSGLALIEQEWSAFYADWPGRDGRSYLEHRVHEPRECGVMVVPKAPLVSVELIRYTDDSGTTTTWDAANYEVDTVATHGAVALKFGNSWPSASLRRANPIEVQFTAGWEDADAVPQALKHAILLMVGHWYINREAVTVGNTASVVSKPLEMAVAALIGTQDRPVYF